MLGVFGGYQTKSFFRNERPPAKEQRRELLLEMLVAGFGRLFAQVRLEERVRAVIQLDIEQGNFSSESANVVFATHFLRLFFGREVGEHTKLICGQIAGDECAEQIAVRQMPGVGEAGLAVDEGHAFAFHGPVLLCWVSAGAVPALAVDQKRVGFEDLVIVHASFAFLQMLVDVDETDTGLGVDREHDGLGRIDGTERHLAKARAFLESQGEGFEIEVSFDVDIAAQLVKRAFDFRVGSGGLVERTEFHGSTFLPRSGIVLLETFQR
jgi:hypothetical protein